VAKRFKPCAVPTSPPAADDTAHTASATATFDRAHRGERSGSDTADRSLGRPPANASPHRAHHAGAQNQANIQSWPSSRRRRE
jgi:hypothetical protein